MAIYFKRLQYFLAGCVACLGAGSKEALPKQLLTTTNLGSRQAAWLAVETVDSRAASAT